MTPEAFYKRMKAFDSNYYCVFAEEHPREILTMDNNLEIAFYLRNGKDIKGLRKIGVEFKRSQISLLKSYGLIKDEKGTLYSNVLFFPEYEANQLRMLSDDAAIRIAAELSGSIGNLREILAESGYSGNLFSIIFSYILDGLVWEQLNKKGELQELSVRSKAQWAGVIWFIEPKRSGTYGTSCTRSGKSAACMTTCKGTSGIKSNKEIIGLLADEFRKKGKVTDEKLISCLEKSNLYKNGELKIPVINENANDSIFKESYRMATIIVEALDKYMDNFQDLKLPEGDERWKSVVIVYHEIMWGIIDILVKAGEVAVPDYSGGSADAVLSEILYIAMKP